MIGIRTITALILLLFQEFRSVAQINSSEFHFPSNVSTSDYSSSYVLVKLKSKSRTLFQSTKNGRVSTDIPGVTGAKHLIDEALLFQNSTSRGPRISPVVVDMSLYYEVACEPGTNIEDFINHLYRSGDFELVEPAYNHKLTFIPNDHFSDQQYYLQNINAYGGWDLSQGSETITIAIVDTGGDLDHPDLIENLYSNPNDPNDGVNNDGDAYFNDFQGWDFVGDDTLNAINPNYIGDNDPGLKAGGNLAHGVNVAGCASARANNSIGISGVGFKTKLMFTKHTADNQKPNRVSVIRAFSGVLYAASKGAKIINCSWGSYTRSQIEQDIIDYVTLDLGSLVVAAAGNDGTARPLYPASYNHVLSVGASDKSNLKATFSNLGSSIDIVAPGVNIFTTDYNDAYATVSGTSFASPIVAGAAALVWAKNPTFTPLQVAEQLRVTANGTELYAKNPNLIYQLGKGLLDIQQALSSSSPSIRATNPKLLSASGNAVEPGQKGYLTMNFNNILKSTSSGIEITISSQSGFAQVTKGTIRPGVIGENVTFANTLIPFEINILAGTPENTVATFLVSYSDGLYKDSQLIDFTLNPSFIDINENLIATTVSGIGRLGYEDTQGSRINGSGFVFNQNEMIFEMGLIMGTPTSLFNNVRGLGGGLYDQDFVSLNKIKQATPGERSNSEISGRFSNSVNTPSQAVLVDYRSLVWKDAPYEKFVILEYTIRNPTAQAITNFHFGIFTDWDITTGGVGDAANWDGLNKMGYAFSAVPSSKPYGGVQLLTGTPEYYAIDNDQRIAGNPFGIYDGFTDAEKFKSISSGLLGKTSAGTGPTGGDISNVVASGPYAIPAGQEIIIAFALHAALNFNDLKTSAQYADSIYNFTLKAPQPIVTESKICYDSPATLNAAGATKIKWYKSFTGGTPFLTGPQFTTPSLKNDTTFYVSNAEKTYESLRSPVNVSVKANPKLFASGASVFCSGESIILSVADADTYLWSTGAATKSITVNSAGTYSVTVTDAALNCQSTSADFITSVNPNPISGFVISTGGALKNSSPISFLNQSTGAVSYVWDFGDGQTSTSPSPTHTYATSSSYTIQLTAYSDKGCQNVLTKSIALITGLPDSPSRSLVTAYPNPFYNSLRIAIDNESAGPISIQITDVLGNIIYETEGGLGQYSPQFDIPLSKLAAGVYLLRGKLNNNYFNQRIVKAE